MKNKTPRVINNRKFSFVIGLLLSVLALVFLIDVGPVARALNFPFIYLFGSLQIVLFIFVYYLGMCLMIKGKVYLSKNVFVIIGAIILCFGFSIVSTSIISLSYTDINISNNFFSQYNAIYSDANKYFNSRMLLFFDHDLPIGGGLIGYTFFGLFAMGGGVSLGLSMGIILMVLGLLLAFEPLIISLISRIKSNNVKKGSLNQPIFHKLSRKEKDDFFKKAASLDGDSNEVPSPIESNNGIVSPSFDNPSGFMEFSQINNNPNGFTKPVFDAPLSESTNAVQKTDAVSLPSFEPAEKNNKEHVEQISLPLEDSTSTVKNDVIAEDSISGSVDEISNSFSEVESSPIKEEKTLPEEPVKPVEPEPAPAPAPVVEEKPFVWIPPSYDLLDEYQGASSMEENQIAAEERQKMINEIFSNFNIGAECIGFTIGPSVTRFHVQYNKNVSSSRVASMVQDISIRLGGLTARFEGVIEGEFYSGLEIANPKSSMVSFKEIVTALPDVEKHPTAVGFGKNIGGKVVAADFAEFPHLLVAGTTGSGKSIYVHSVIATLIMRMSPKDLKVVLVDPKRVEMTKYRDMPHLLCPIITDADKATVMMNKLADEMNNRYSKFEEANSCSDIKQYNKWAKENNRPTLPYILAVLDEYADLVDSNKEISKPVVSIAQKARAAGIHLLISTQRPSTNVITGTIKANLATRVALMTANYVDSMTIIGEGGAEKLLGKGDMLVQSALVSRVGFVRLQGCFVNNDEINRVVSYLRENYKTEYDPNFLDLVDHSKEAGQAYVASGEIMDGVEDEEEIAYQSIKEWTMSQVSISISKIQRECGVGFSRAGRFFIRMQKEGVVSYEKDPVTKGCFVLQIDKFSEAGRQVSSEEQSSYKDDEH